MQGLPVVRWYGVLSVVWEVFSRLWEFWQKWEVFGGMQALPVVWGASGDMGGFRSYGFCLQRRDVFGGMQGLSVVWAGFRLYGALSVVWQVFAIMGVLARVGGCRWYARASGGLGCVRCYEGFLQLLEFW